MLKGQDGKVCVAKNAYILTLITVLVKMLLSGASYGEIEFGEAKLAEMALILAATAATYFGRAKTKADSND